MPSTAASPSFPCETCEVRDQTICAALDDVELRKLNAIATSVTLGLSDTIFYEGDRDTYLFNVTTGAVRLSKLLPDGRRQITGFLFPGDLLGLSISGVYAYTAEAITETSLCRFDRRRLTEIAEKYPKLEHRIVALASNELVQAQDHLVILGQKRASERIATLLLRLAERIGSRTGAGRVVELPMSREDIADYAGLTIETVSRNLSRLREAGIIEILSSRRIHIPRTGALEELSGDL
jgi:CRP/FNR family transcriptional regulator